MAASSHHNFHRTPAVLAYVEPHLTNALFDFTYLYRQHFSNTYLHRLPSNDWSVLNDLF
jgi:hypothetical protein